jgi:hypothetical protein
MPTYTLTPHPENLLQVSSAMPAPVLQSKSIRHSRDVTVLGKPRALRRVAVLEPSQSWAPSSSRRYTCAFALLLCPGIGDLALVAMT